MNGICEKQLHNNGVYDNWSVISILSIINESQQMFASKYLPYMPSEEEIKREIEDSTLRIENGIEK